MTPTTRSQDAGPGAPPPVELGRFDAVRRPSRARMAFRRVEALPQIVLFPVTLVLVLLIWEGIVRYFEVQIFIFPPPSMVYTQLVAGVSIDPRSSGSLVFHWYYTVKTAFIGFAAGSLGGLFLGTVIAQRPILRKALFPLLVGINSMPKIAIAPVLIIWFGIGTNAQIALVILVVFFPVLINSLSGFAAVESDQLDLMRSIRASEWQVFRRLKIQTALPYIFAGLEIAVVSSLLATIVAEFVGGQRGLGVQILQRSLYMNTSGIFAILLMLALTGIIMLQTLIFLRKRFLFWGGEEISARRGR
jgi:NitT/TauT family transport system permease protein